MQNHKLNKKFVQTRRNHHFELFNKSRVIVFTAILLSFGAIIPEIISLSSATASAATSTAKNDISIKVSGYCSVSNENHTYNKEIGTGSFSEIGSGNVFDIYCNDEEGYVVYAVGNGKDVSSGDGAVKEGVTDLIGSNTNNVIHTGINQSGDESGWSFKLSNATSGMVIEDGFSNNSLIPSTRTKVVSRPAGTAAATGDNFTATYSAYISTSQEPDTYTGGVKYILFHPSSTVFYEINYNLNSGSWTGTSPETGTEAGGYVNISSIIPTKNGYDFKGWCDTQVTNNNSSSPTCSGQTYQAGNGVELPNSNNIIDLYAIWKTSGPTNYGNVGNLQNFSCSKFTMVGDTGTAKDSRDNNTYTIAKLADGKCWMTDNLRISGKNLTSADSDVASSFNLPTSNKGGFDSYDVANVYVDSNYGGYYTWYAATAGEGKRSFSSGDTQHSICPKGWRLPTKAEFDSLVSAQGAAKMTQSPADFKLGGLYYDGSSESQTSYGYYWPSTASYTDSAYRLVVNSRDAYTNFSYKYFGFSVRCVSRQ